MKKEGREGGQERGKEKKKQQKNESQLREDLTMKKQDKEIVLG